MPKLLTLDEFLDKIPTDKPQDYDGAFGGECIDLIKFLLDWVYWLKPGRIGNANELFEDKYKVLSNLFKQIHGSMDLLRWDIIFLNTGISFQHVGIFLRDLGDSVEIFDQVWNWDKVGWEIPPWIRKWPKSIVRWVWRSKAIDSVSEEINEFCDQLWIRKRWNDEFYSCREILSILVRMQNANK